MKQILMDLERSGWATLPGCFGAADSLRLRQECQDSCEIGAFRPAGVGRGAGLSVRPEIRSDHVLWLESADASVEQQLYLAWLELLRLALNQRFFLGLFDFEGHFAIYPEGAFYKAHLDRHAGTSGRIVTTILYLNPHWQPGDGGELKIWTTCGEKTGAFVLIEPRLGTMVCFLAGDFWHEVLPAVKTRMSITGWFRQR
jgi:SM-20-related protein